MACARGAGGPGAPTRGGAAERRGGPLRGRGPRAAAEGAGRDGRTADPGLRGRRRRAAVRGPRRPGHPRPQRGDGPAPLPGCPEGGRLRPVPRPDPPRRRDASLPSPEIRDHGRVRRDRRGSDGGLPGPVRRRMPVAHGGAVPASLQGSHAAGGIRDAGDVRGPRGCGARDRLSARPVGSPRPKLLLPRGGTSVRGVVAAASYEARKSGVHSAMPTATAKRLCPKGIFLPVRMSRYAEMSDKVFAIYRRFTPLGEPLSIDEAFLDVTGCERLFGSAQEVARKIKSAVREETGLTVSAGVAPNKFLAKIASDLGKPDGPTAVPPRGAQAVLDPPPVGKVWGVGKVTGETLLRRGIRTIGDLRRASRETLVRAFGAHGEHLHRLSRGIDDRPVETEREAKSIGHEDTYDHDLRDRGAMRRELLSLSDRA